MLSLAIKKKNSSKKEYLLKLTAPLLECKVNKITGHINHIYIVSYTSYFLTNFLP